MNETHETANEKSFYANLFFVRIIIIQAMHSMQNGKGNITLSGKSREEKTVHFQHSTVKAPYDN